ncbi:hypothetical protein E2C01_060026 [Portunus trituberculatus]|uniref:Uncharacterized protein n=1 Tax=Portunus trituberculatus TaxID=210409 RepID=A0A5B7HA91_PORTR|nr:hypothetical protein [Portunus trituberculatus]
MDISRHHPRGTEAIPDERADVSAPLLLSSRVLSLLLVLHKPLTSAFLIPPHASSLSSLRSWRGRGAREYANDVLDDSGGQ